jgi:hypothetical protein
LAAARRSKVGWSELLWSVVGKADSPGFRWRFWGHELLDRLDQNYDLFIVISQLSLKLGDFASKLLVSGKNLTELNKCSNHEDTDLDGLLRVQDTGRYDGAMLRERKGESFGKLELFEVVAICDHLCLLLWGELKHEVAGEAL